MRILLLTQLFDPEPNHLKGLKFVRALASAGHQVKVFTCLPNYPVGRIYDGYRHRFWSRESASGVEILRLPLYPSHDRSGVRRSICYGSYALSASAAIAMMGSSDVVHVYQGPATLGLPALVNRGLRKVPFVLDIQDLWPDTIELSGMSGSSVVVRAAGHWCSHVYERAQRIVTLSRGMMEALVARGVPEKKIDVVYNWADDVLCETEHRDETRASLGLGDRLVVMYAGNMGHLQALEHLIEAAGRLRDRGSRATVVLVGDGTELPGLRSRVKELQLSNVVFMGRQPLGMMSRFYAAADVLFMQLRDSPLSAITIPQKLQAYMAAGRPILAAIRGEGADLVSESKGGIVCEPENAADIAAKILQFEQMGAAARETMGANAKKFFLAQFTMEAGVRRFEQIYRRAVEEARASA